MQTEKALQTHRARTTLRGFARLSTVTLLAAAVVAIPGAAKAGGTVVKNKPGVAKPSNQAIELTRRDFYKLGLRMLGTSKLVGETSVMLSQPGWKEQKPCKVGESIGGFKIVSIQSGYTIFERGGVHLWLAIGDDTAPSSADLKQAAKDLADLKSIKSKRANRFLKQGANGAPKYSIPENEEVTEEDVDIADLHSGGKDWVPDVKSSDPMLKTAFPRASQQNGRFAMPAQGRLGSPFGYRKHPMGGGRKYHRGVDLEIPSGTKVVASAAGTVVNVARNWAKGVYIELDHGNGFTTHYFHLSSVNVRKGQVVKQGQKIASSGSTGMSTGPHLHFEIHKGEIPVDPALYVKEIGR